MLLKALIMNINDAVMIPIPQYPLYSAALTLYGGSTAPYYLDESKGWQLDMSELERALQESKAKGKKVKAIVVINPGNPTGAIFSPETINKILEFSVRNNLVVIADEVLSLPFRSTEKISIRKGLPSTHLGKCWKQWAPKSKKSASLLLYILAPKDFWDNAGWGPATSTSITSTLLSSPKWSSSNPSVSAQEPQVKLLWTSWSILQPKTSLPLPNRNTWQKLERSSTPSSTELKLWRSTWTRWWMLGAMKYKARCMPSQALPFLRRRSKPQKRKDNLLICSTVWTSWRTQESL